MWGNGATVLFLVCFALGTFCKAQLARSEASHSADGALISSQDIDGLGNEYELSVTGTNAAEKRMFEVQFHPLQIDATIWVSPSVPIAIGIIAMHFVNQG